MPKALTERVFTVSNLLVGPFWLLMMLFPKARLTRRLMGSPWAVAAPAALYALWGGALLTRQQAQSGDAAAGMASLLRPTAAGIAAGFALPEFATLGWAHLLAFDLFTGRWIYLDSQARGIPPLLVAPALFFTLMTGPVGFLLYLIIRLLHGGQPTHARIEE